MAGTKFFSLDDLLSDLAQTMADAEDLKTRVTKLETLLAESRQIDLQEPGAMPKPRRK